MFSFTYHKLARLSGDRSINSSMTFNKDWTNSTGMDSDVNEHISVDDMYLVLQADMIDIKKQEKSLLCEIEELSQKFKNLLKTCGLESEFTDTCNFPAPPPTPSFLQSNATINHLNNMTSSTSSDEDYLLQQLLQFPISSLLDSDNDMPCLNNTLSKPVMDSNCNYVNTEPITELPIIPPPPSDNELISEYSSYSKNNTNVSESTSSDISNCRTSTTSDGYPRSSGDSSSINNMDKEYMSRIKHYSNFTINRQQKLKELNRLAAGSTSTPNIDKTEKAPVEFFCRHVEGAEDGISSIRASGTASSSGSVSDCSSNGTSGSCSRRVRSSKSDNRTPRNKTSSSHGSRKSNSFPKASSTMIEDDSPSSQTSSKKSNSIPQASSTMIEEDFAFTRSSGCGSSNDRDSIYTWSINVSDDTTLEKSFFRNYKNYQHKKVWKKARSNSSKSDSSRSGKEPGGRNVRSHRNEEQKLDCQDYKLHKMISEQCSLKMLGSMSAIEPVSGYRDAFVLCSDSLYEEDDDFHGRSNTLPRSSTKIRVVEKSSGSSSMEARRASMPDILSVCTPYEDCHSIPSSTSDSADSSPLPDRLSIQGKSSTSAGTSGSQSYSHGSNSVASPCFPGNVTAASTVQEPETEGLIDSILTDSPNSVSSSGIYVPCNSPIMTDNSCAASRASYATVSEKLINSPCKLNPVKTIIFQAPSEKSSVVDKKSNAIFKVPKSTQPLRKLLRLKRKVKTPDSTHRTFLPKCTTGPSSVQSDPLSKRRLFPSSRTHSETKLMDKKAVIKKFKRFSDSFYKRDKSGNINIETLAHF
ncbi:hypothetical protein ScPMuIL_010294 [Solemya velum]